MRLKQQLAGVLGAGILAFGGATGALAYQTPVTPVVQQMGQGTFENMIAALENLGAESEQLSTRSDLTVNSIRMFEASDLAAAGDPWAFSEAVAMHGEEIQNLHATIYGNETVLEVLQAVKVPVESVVAVDNLDLGDLAIYFQQPRMMQEPLQP